MKIRLIGGPKDGEVIDAPTSFSKKNTTGDWLTYTLDRVNGEFVGIFEDTEDAV